MVCEIHFKLPIEFFEGIACLRHAWLSSSLSIVFCTIYLFSAIFARRLPIVCTKSLVLIEWLSFNWSFICLVIYSSPIFGEIIISDFVVCASLSSIHSVDNSINVISSSHFTLSCVSIVSWIYGLIVDSPHKLEREFICLCWAFFLLFFFPHFSEIILSQQLFLLVVCLLSWHRFHPKIEKKVLESFMMVRRELKKATNEESKHL